ncbi:MAG: response regulator transcription factor [Alistipes sp.]|nr:response regulator transcription factor [Alistipes sp.]
MSEQKNDIKIVLVDDHALFRNGLRELISMREGYRVVGEASDGDEFLKLLPHTAVDLVFMDIAMPRMGGADATREALSMRPDLKIICLSMFGEEGYYSRMVDAGVKGFLLKDSSIDEVFGAIDAVAAGGDWFSPTLMNSISKSAGSAEESPREELSSREVEVLLGICRGLSTQEIADELFISKRTADAHRAKILEKTGCKNTASLVVYAIRHRLVGL